MSVPDEYYVILPAGGLAEMLKLLKGKKGDNIPDSIRQKVDEYLVDNGEWTDVPQLKKKDRKFCYWTIGGMDKVVVEQNG